MRSLYRASKRASSRSRTRSKRFPEYDLEVPSHGSAKPWDGFITRVEIRAHGDGFVKLSREGATLAFEGGDAKRWGALVANIKNFHPRRGSGHHQHIDYYEDHYFLPLGSVALILSSPKDGA